MNRRRIIATAPLLALGPRIAQALPATPRQSAGPFYPDTLPLDHDNDLVRIASREDRAAGTLLDLTGRVLRADGSAVAGARVEIWQCDANGRYHHPRDTRGPGRDPAFQGYGRTVAADGGGYRFRTIRPVPYPGRTPHIHFAVSAPGGAPLVTQMYVRGEPGNAGDFLYARIPEALREQVTVALVPDPATPGALAGRFDVVLPG